MRGLEGHSAAIIGGTGGIGQATAALLAKLGARLTIGGRDRQRLAKTAGSLPDGAQESRCGQ